ncbi:hypothetical protein ACK337_20090 [Aeromonas veronii]
MSKIRIINIILVFSCLVMGGYPFLNVASCNAVFEMESDHYKVSGRCERGRINSTIINKDYQDSYLIEGRLAMLGEQYFIFVDNVSVIEQSKQVSSRLKKYKYQRSIMSGRYIDNHIFTYTPYPHMGKVNIVGRLSIW